MNYRDREQLFEDIDDFHSGDVDSCYCSATSSPPCGWCEHPGNLTHCDDKEILKMVDMRDVLGDSEFYPGDEVYTKDDLKSFIGCIHHNYTKPRPKEITAVSVGVDGTRYADLGPNLTLPFGKLYHRDQAKTEITKMLANGITTIQAWEF